MCRDINAKDNVQRAEKKKQKISGVCLDTRMKYFFVSDFQTTIIIKPFSDKNDSFDYKFMLTTFLILSH